MNVVEVDDAADERLEDYSAVRDPVRLRRDGVFLVEGRLAVGVLLSRSPFVPRSVLCSPRTRDWLEASDFDTGDLPVYVARNEVLDALVGLRFHQGCLAAGVRPVPRTVSSLLEETDRPRRLVVLDGVSNPDNVGAIFRTAAAFRVGGAVLTAPCVSPLYRKAIRTSMGASLWLPFSHCGHGLESVSALQASGYTVAALMPDEDAMPLPAFAADGPLDRLALMLGSEGHGLDRATSDAADVRVGIPIDPDVDSLNVAAAAAVALYATR